MNSSSVATDSTPQPTSTGIVDACEASRLEVELPKCVKISSVPRMNAKSPMRLTMKAFLAASEADFFLY